MTTGIGNVPTALAIMVMIGPGPSGPGLAAKTSIAMSTSCSMTSSICSVGSPSRITRSGVIQRRIGFFQRLRAHDVGDPQPLLVLVLGFDDAQHHHAAADPDRPAAGVVDRAVPFRGVVNDNQTFRLVIRLVASSLGGHACPDAAPNRRMLPRRG